MPEFVITKQTLERDLSAVGLGRGDHVVVHCSLSKIGHVEGGPQALLDAFLGVLGPEGTVLVPTFTYSFSGRSDMPPFDRKNTPGSRVGIFAETVRMHPSACRSGHPTHAVSAMGRRAREFTEGHELISALGRGSPLHKAAEAGGYILLIGVTHNRNSSIHIAEVLAGVPYTTIHFCEDWGRTGRVVREDGRIEHVPLHPEIPGCSRGFDAADKPLRERGVIKDGRIGGADAMRMKGLDMIEAVRDLLKEHPSLVLCDYLNCDTCIRRKAAVGAALARKSAKGAEPCR